MNLIPLTRVDETYTLYRVWIAPTAIIAVHESSRTGAKAVVELQGTKAIHVAEDPNAIDNAYIIAS